MLIMAPPVPSASTAQTPHHISAAVHPTRREARWAARIIARRVIVPFTESAPSIHSVCSPRARSRICTVHVRGDRIDAIFRLRVTFNGDVFMIYGSKLISR